jgi:hypothetical protein
MRLPLMSEEASTVTLIHPAPGASAKEPTSQEPAIGEVLALVTGTVYTVTDQSGMTRGSRCGHTPPDARRG